MIIGSDEWKKWRRDKVGASDVSAILGLSPWMTPYDLWEQKILGKEIEMNSSMLRGQEREEEARKWVESKIGTILFPKVYEHKKCPFFTATLDGIDEDEENAVEIKWPNKKVMKMAEAGEVIDYYYCQIQYQMEVVGLEDIYFCCCNDKEKILINKKRDQPYIDAMMKKVIEFFDECILLMQPPDLREKDKEKLKDKSFWNIC